MLLLNVIIYSMVFSANMDGILNNARTEKMQHDLARLPFNVYYFFYHWMALFAYVFCDVSCLLYVFYDVTCLLYVLCDVTRLLYIFCDVTCLLHVFCDVTWCQHCLLYVFCDITFAVCIVGRHMMPACFSLPLIDLYRCSSVQYSNSFICLIIVLKFMLSFISAVLFLT